ncbi:MAG: hypothetical protein KME17_17625 [Cyanosarcina radialis HA8281-LM2]|jgi:hypothetical protein|nr:hypothetical protein [Cyanosarcina radialis HA8281-LM2]
MDTSKRRKLIGNSLGIKPINHGQLYTFQIAVPESDTKDISYERHQLISKSLTECKSNLIPLIVRPTEKYSQEEEYEVVYGADWCLVAKKIEIEKLWAWVFDLTDDQAAAAKEEMEKLASSSKLTETPNSIEQIKIQLQQLETSFKQQLEGINQNLEQLVSSQVKEKLSKEPDETLKKLPNLVSTTQREIEDAIGNKRHGSAAWKAIKRLKNTGRDITWENLEKLAKTKKGEDKIEGFGEGIFKNLKQACQIS